jgi:hypothetical protein
MLTSHLSCRSLGAIIKDCTNDFVCRRVATETNEHSTLLIHKGKSSPEVFVHSITEIMPRISDLRRIYYHFYKTAAIFTRDCNLQV